MLPMRVADVIHRSAVGAQVIGDNLFWLTVALHQFLEEFQRCLAVATLGDKVLEDLAFVIYGTPHVMGLAVDFHEDLVDMPLPIRVTAHPTGPGFADLRGEKRAKPHPLKSDGIVADVNAALMQEVFHIS